MFHLSDEFALHPIKHGVCLESLWLKEKCDVAQTPPYTGDK
jgi:hypothetical protein